jgi:hypothetical protein
MKNYHIAFCFVALLLASSCAKSPSVLVTGNYNGYATKSGQTPQAATLNITEIESKTVNLVLVITGDTTLVYNSVLLEDDDGIVLFTKNDTGGSNHVGGQYSDDNKTASLSLSYDNGGSVPAIVTFAGTKAE